MTAHPPRGKFSSDCRENLSVEGSYDNAGDVSSALGGNLGGDVRWRLEFQ